MKQIIKLLVIQSLLGWNYTSFGQNSPNYEIQIKTYLDTLTKEEFSGVILVAKDNEVIEKRAYNLASREYTISNEIDTKFNIASITKMFTAVAILQLYQKGKIKLHQPIGKYLPDYPNSIIGSTVTIHQLLTHTSGIGQYYANFLPTNKLNYQEVADYLPLFAQDTLLSKPGTQYNYSGSGFVVLALIIEAITEETYYDYLSKNIFEPTQMSNTLALEIDEIVSNKATGYTHFPKEEKTLKTNTFYLSKADGAGWYYSTVDDLYKFSKALRAYKLLNKSTTNLMFTPMVKGYNTNLGYGIDLDLRYNQTIQGHSGGWYGVRGELMDFTKDNYTIVILSNLDDDGKSGTTKVVDFFKKLIAKKN